MRTLAADLPVPTLLETLSARDLVFLSEILRLEDSLHRFAPMESEGERVMVELLLDQLELIVDQLSPEDDFLWGNVWRVMDWLHETSGTPEISEEEVARFRDIALEIANLDTEA